MERSAALYSLLVRLIAARSVLPAIVFFICTGHALATTDANIVPEKSGIDEHRGAQVNLDLEFRDSNGEQKKLRDFFIPNRPVILTPVYYGCPNLCTYTLNGTVKLLNELKLVLGKDLNVISFSINPEEKPPLAAEKAANYHRELQNPAQGSAGWHFLTGSAQVIEELTREIGFRYAPDGSEFMHAAVILLLTNDGKISRYFYGIEYPVKDVRLSLVEASEGRIGTIGDRILLFCFSYDHLTGRYSLLIWNVVRAASFATVLALVTLLVTLRLREIAGRERNA